MFMKKLSLKNIYLLVAAAVVTSFGSCKKIDDLVIFRDPMAMDPQIWEQEAAVQFLLNETYQFIIPHFPYEISTNNYYIHLVSDENFFSANETLGKKVFNFSGFLTVDDSKYVGAKYQGTTYGDNRYFDIAKCNLAIKNLPGSKGIPEANKKELLGQFYALRGMGYFGLTKIYGGMPLVLDPQNPQELTLGGREKARVMFDQILKDYDSAIVNLEGVTYDPATERGKLTKAAVMCLKAQALKWWASPLFNPNGDAARWDKAFTAIEDAYNAAVKAGHKLLPDYGKIFQTEGAANTEAIIVRSYSPSQPKKFQQVESRSRPSSEGGSPNDCYNPSKQMLDAYPMKDGLPATTSQSSAAYPFNEVVFWANRDPRFDATIIWNGAPWPLSGKTARKQWTYAKAAYSGKAESTKPFYVKRFSNPALASGSVVAANDLGGNGYDWIEYRFAELILDYAEAANETGKLSLAKDMVRIIRKRAGIVEGTPSTNDYGLVLATDQAKMRDLILNERMVEFAFEGKRNDDLRRTRRMHLLQGSLAQMQQLQPAYANAVKDLETPIGTNTLGLDPNTPRRDTVDMYNPASVQKYFVFPYSWGIPSGNGNFAMPESYYFLPLSSQFLNSTPLLNQTIGWEGGTFDPLSE
jgi:starch-binding outer membrane protein, SusD/RagB family